MSKSPFRSRTVLPGRVKAKVSGESKTKQSFAQDANINTMVRKHLGGPGRFGAPIGSPLASRKPYFGEVPAESYHDMLNRITEVQMNFRSLPSRVRSMFQNNPAVLLQWVQDPNNYADAVKMGLIEDPEVLHALKKKEAAADREAAKAGEKDSGEGHATKADDEANPRYTPPKKGGKSE